MDIYESIIKQSNIVNFVVDSADTVIDTNMYTMMFLDTYDITGRDFYSLFDDMSQLKIRSCLMSGYFDSMDVNFKTPSGDLKPVDIAFSKVGNYMTVFGLPKKHKAQSLSSQLEEISRRAVLESNTGAISDIQSESEKRMWQLNNIDSLTGLYNRKFYSSMFESVLSKALQGGKEIGIILIEIDNFEEINEMHGSAKGERVLVGLAQIGLSCIRSTDYAIRYSNQQILLILNSTKESSISVIAERIRDNAEKKVGITVSIGCTSFTPVSMKDREDFINCALNALEMSRTHGGNRVTIL